MDYDTYVIINILYDIYSYNILSIGNDEKYDRFFSKTNNT